MGACRGCSQSWASLLQGAVCGWWFLPAKFCEGRRHAHWHGTCGRSWHSPVLAGSTQPSPVPFTEGLGTCGVIWEGRCRSDEGSAQPTLLSHQKHVGSSGLRAGFCLPWKHLPLPQPRDRLQARGWRCSSALREGQVGRLYPWQQSGSSVSPTEAAGSASRPLSPSQRDSWHCGVAGGFVMG